MSDTIQAEWLEEHSMTRDRGRLLFVTLAMVASAWAGAAQRADCRGVAGNLLTTANCGFDKDVSSWRATADTSVAYKPATANDPASAAMNVTSSTQGSLTAISACVPVRAGTAYQFSAWLRLSSGTPYFCALNAWQYTDPKCSEGSQPLGTAGRPPASAWATLQGQASTQANAMSALLRAECSGQGTLAIEWDDFVLAPSAAK
jgi:hypothetical protein